MGSDEDIGPDETETALSSGRSRDGVIEWAMTASQSERLFGCQRDFGRSAMRKKNPVKRVVTAYLRLRIDVHS